MWIARRVATVPYQSFAVFRDAERLESAVIDLCMSGLDRTEFSLVARDGVLQDRLRRAYTVLNDTAEIAPSAEYSTLAGNGFAVGLLTYASALAASIGMALHGEPVATILVGAVVGGGFGAFAGAVLSRLLDRRRNASFDEQLARGAVLLLVRTADHIKEASAARILARHAARDIRSNRLVPAG